MSTEVTVISKKRTSFYNCNISQIKKNAIITAFFLIYVFSDLFIHHRIRDDFKYSVITASASGRAMSGLLNVRKDVKQVFDLGMFLEGIKDVEVGYVLAVADLEILYGLGIDGF